MESEAEAQKSSTPRLQLLAKPYAHHAYVHSPPRSPLYTSASIPFRWEEEPGKPRGSTANPIDESSPKCLELPPRMLFLDVNVPTTVVEGPYVGKSRFQSSSFSIMRRECYGSFRSERGQLSSLVVSKRSVLKGKGFLGSWRWGWRGFRGKREVVGASYVFPSSMDKELLQDDKEEASKEEETSVNNVKITRIRRSGSFASHSSSHFWATVYEGLKQVIPWKSKKLKKEGFGI